MDAKLLSDPLLGVTLTFIVFEIATAIQKRTRLAILNPVLVSLIAIIAILKILDIDVESYQSGGMVLTFFIKPATVALAVPLYKNFDLLKRNFKSIITGITTGVSVSLMTLLALAKVMNLPDDIVISSAGRNITTPIAMELADKMGGIVTIAIVMVFFTGIWGVIIGPALLEKLGIRDSTAKGIALGTTAHAIGTAKAITMGEDIGAMSAVAIPITGIITVFLAPIVFNQFF